MTDHAFVATDHGWIRRLRLQPRAEHLRRRMRAGDLDRPRPRHRACAADGLALLERLFVDVLDGHPLIGRTAADGGVQRYERLTRCIDLPPEQMFALLGRRHPPLLPYVLGPRGARAMASRK